MESTVRALIAYDAKLRKSLYRLLAVYFLFVIVLMGLGYAYFEDRKKEILNQRKEELSTIAELKVEQVVNWRNERLADASKLAPIFEDSNKISQLLKVMNKDERNRMFYRWTRQFYDHLEYKGIYLYSTSLNEVAFKSENADSSLGRYEHDLASSAVKNKEAVMSDLYRNGSGISVNLDIYAPVVENRAGGAGVVGLLLLRIDPEKFLFPFVQTWPVETKTFETLLVRREGDNALYLNKLRFLRNAALSYFVPLSSKRSPATMAASGFEGLTEGINYRGNLVVAAIKAVPGSTWKLIAKIDKEEVYAPVRRRALLISLLVLCSVLAAGAIVGSIWYQQIGNIYKKQYEAEVERKTIAKKYDYLIRYANIIILILDKDFKVIEANDKALSSYQYSRAEMLELNAKDLQAPESLEAFTNEFDILNRKGNHIFKTYNQRKDGSTFQVEMNLQHFVIEWNEFYQVIIRDLS